MSDDNAKSNSSENVNNGFPLEELVESLSQNPQLISIVEVRAKFQRSRERESCCYCCCYFFFRIHTNVYEEHVNESVPLEMFCVLFYSFR